MFIDDITDHLMTLLSTATNNIILGDFNMNLNDINSNDACTFLDTFTALGLTQHVTTSTHVKGNILDLMFTEETSNIKLTSCQAGPFQSDHKLVTPHSISIDNLLRRRNFQYVNLTALLKITSKLPLTKVPLT